MTCVISQFKACKLNDDNFDVLNRAGRGCLESNETKERKTDHGSSNQFAHFHSPGRLHWNKTLKDSLHAKLRSKMQCKSQAHTDS